jgi:hypothetical protein
MWASITKKLLLLTYFFMVLDVSHSLESPESREKKHFSLFSVVTFKNDQCTSLSTLAGGARAGTCYSATECSDKSGTKSGNCASGFGVCCLFLNTAAATATISENRTHLRNSAYPSYETATAAVSIVYTIKKMNSDICQIRLDFSDFIIGGPILTTEAGASVTASTLCTNDNLVIGSTSGKLRGAICGALTGEHLYVELSPTSTDTATLTLSTVVSTTLLPATAQRVWDIQTSQIPCYATYRAPAGCDRYLMTDTGKITSLNFYKVSGSTQAAQTSSAGQNTGIELMLQNVNTCIRRSKGMCCVEYQVCTADTQGILLTDETCTACTTAFGHEGAFNEGWSLDTDTTPYMIVTTQSNAGMVDSLCSGDYVSIPSSFSGACGGGTGSAANAINSRYCGARFGINLWATTQTITSNPVCDCSEPFHVRHVTDTASDLGGSISTNTANGNTVVSPRGFCLDFRQTPCWQR